ncbi:uncharacterized protein LOC124844559 [Vigna umbellata]|uniref:uncharacterized protein LOC124844559 n=1 Tax=Vigna umbellata TaxID=87088 RepID=UPI001F5E7364|nr:uncharacterized protein LOC124844559 [Vigna umbellata]
MKRALLSKNKIKFIDGSIKKPQKINTLFDAWERCNMMILSWITKTLSPQIVESVIYVEEAKELWDDLKERFSKGDYFKISDLLQDIHSIKQGERGVSQFFTDLKILWEELDILRPIPTCTCQIPCSCDLSRISLKYREMVHVICFLKGLNDSYNTVRTQILLMDPLPNINRVFSLIMQQERQEKQGSADIKVLANVADRSRQWKSEGRGSGFRGQGKGRGKNPNYGKQCSYCNKMNHTIDECYSKHGYPPWYKKGDNNQDKKNDWSSANACQNNTEPEGIQNTHHTNNSNIFNSFTAEQMQKLLRMIDKVDEPTHKVNQVQRNETENKQGYKSGVKGYIVLDINTKELLISRNVLFHEDIFPYKNLQGNREDYDTEEDKADSLNDLLRDHYPTNDDIHAELDVTDQEEVQQPSDDGGNSDSTGNNQEN